MKQHSVIERYFVEAEVGQYLSLTQCVDYEDMFATFLRHLWIAEKEPRAPFVIKGGIIRQSAFGISCEILHERKSIFY